MDNGGAILSFSDEFGKNSVEKCMKNDGPNLKENNIPNKVTPYFKQQISQDDLNVEIQPIKGAKNFGTTPQSSYEGNELEG